MTDFPSFLCQLSDAVSAAWPDGSSVPHYQSVKVLLMSWDREDDPQVHQDLRALESVFHGLYNYDTESWRIPSRRSAVELSRKVADVLDVHGREGNLVILYYIGYARPATGDQRSSSPIWAATPSRDSPVVHSSVLHSLLTEVDCHVLLLHDCLDTPRPSKPENSFAGNGLIETISAGSIDVPSHDSETPKNWFTTAVIQELAHAAHTGVWLTGAELHRRLIHRLQSSSSTSSGILFHQSLYSFVQIDRQTGQPMMDPSPTRRIPIHKYEANRPQTVLLAPRDPAKEPSENSAVMLHPPASPSPAEPETNSPGVLVTCRLRDPRVEVERWRQWLLNAPEQARKIQLSAIYPGFSTVLIVELPLAVWNMLAPSPAMSFIAYTTGRNHISEFRRALTGGGDPGEDAEGVEHEKRSETAGSSRASEGSRPCASDCAQEASPDSASQWPQLFQRDRTAAYQLEDTPYCLNVAELLPQDGASKTDRILRAFLQGDGPATRYISEEIEGFCAPASFEALVSGRDAHPEPVAILDERVLDERHLSGNEVRILNRTELYEALVQRSLPQLIDTEESDNIFPRRRLLYVTNPDALSTLAIVATASERQAWALQDFVYNHLTMQSSLKVSIEHSATRPQGFHLSFHFPYLAWRQGTTPALDTRLRNASGSRGNAPLRRTHDLSALEPHLENGVGNDDNEDIQEEQQQQHQNRPGTYLHEAQISCMVAGLDNRHWTAYGFFDTYQDRDVTDEGHFRFGRRDVLSYQSTQGGVMRDPLTCGQLMLEPSGSSLPDAATVWDARSYFLHAMHGCVREVASEWKNTGRQVLKAVGQAQRCDAHQANQAIQALEQLIQGLRGTLSAWQRFQETDLPTYFAIEAPATKALIREIDNNIRDLHALQQDLHQQAETIKSRIQTIQTTSPMPNLPPPTTHPFLSFFGNANPTTTALAIILSLLLPIPLALLMAGLLILLLPHDWLPNAPPPPSSVLFAAPQAGLAGPTDGVGLAISATATAATAMASTATTASAATPTAVVLAAASHAPGATTAVATRYLLTSAVVATLGATLGAAAAACMFFVLVARGNDASASASAAAAAGKSCVREVKGGSKGRWCRCKRSLLGLTCRSGRQARGDGGADRAGGVSALWERMLGRLMSFIAELGTKVARHGDSQAREEEDSGCLPGSGSSGKAGQGRRWGWLRNLASPGRRRNGYSPNGSRGYRGPVITGEDTEDERERMERGLSFYGSIPHP
ncbi:hypothetical protein VTJ83DRAFT_1373 [Remersonia thermophila]|uniref:Uncharacterized protein n=1 Tax=Remersonia thermophila TaxID=72144 RepID=A0ABR4DNV8_9PEZI